MSAVPTFLITEHKIISRRVITLLACSALVACLPFYAVAQEKKNDGATLEAIVVDGVSTGIYNNDSKSIVPNRTTSGSKLATDIFTTPAMISVITAKEIEMRGAETIEEVVQYTPGVTGDFYGSDDRFDFLKVRGLDATAYRDGMSIGRTFGGIREDAFAYERVEVIKGANSTAFGVSDPGGALHYVTKRPRSERFGQAYVTGGSYSNKEVGVDFGDNITDDGTLSYRITGKLRDANAEYDYSRDNEKFFLGGLTWRPTDMTNLTILYDHLNKDGTPNSGGHPVGTNFSRSSFFGEPDYNYRGTNRNTITMLFDHDFDNGLKFNTTGRYMKSTSNYGYAYISATPTSGSTLAERDFFVNDSQNSQFIVDSNLQYESALTDDIYSRSMIGGEINNTRSSTRSWIGDAPSIDWTNPIYTGRPTALTPRGNSKNTSSVKSIYGQQEFEIWDQLTVSLGLRNDWLDLEQLNRGTGVTTRANYSELSKRFGASYKVTDELAPFVNYTTSVATPSIGVEPELGEQFEVGIKYQPEAFPALITASVYDLTKNNITRRNPATNLDETIGEVSARGFEIEGKFDITEQWDILAGYSYIKTDIVENGTTGNKGNQLGLVPNHTASLWVRYTLPENDTIAETTVAIGARYNGSSYFADTNTTKVASNLIFDAALSYEVTENTKLEANISNIFNEKHVAYGGFGADFYNTGRAINVTLRKTW